MVFHPNDAIYKTLHVEKPQKDPQEGSTLIPTKLAMFPGLPYMFVSLVESIRSDPGSPKWSIRYEGLVDICKCEDTKIVHNFWYLPQEDRQIFENPNDICVTLEKAENQLIIARHRTMSAYNMEKKKCLWTISGHLPGMQKPLNPASICTDGSGNLYVADSGNYCVHMFTTEGKFISTVLQKGDLGIGRPLFVRWSNEDQILVLLHELQNTSDMPVGFEKKNFACGISLSI